MTVIKFVEDYPCAVFILYMIVIQTKNNNAKIAAVYHKHLFVSLIFMIFQC